MHGDRFHGLHTYSKQCIGFLQESKMCILNGRVTPDKNDLTLVSNRCTSVVYYIIFNQDPNTTRRSFSISMYTCSVESVPFITIENYGVS